MDWCRSDGAFDRPGAETVFRRAASFFRLFVSATQEKKEEKAMKYYRIMQQGQEVRDVWRTTIIGVPDDEESTVLSPKPLETKEGKCNGN